MLRLLALRISAPPKTILIHWKSFLVRPFAPRNLLLRRRILWDTSFYVLLFAFCFQDFRCRGGGAYRPMSSMFLCLFLFPGNSELKKKLADPCHAQTHATPYHQRSFVSLLFPGNSPLKKRTFDTHITNVSLFAFCFQEIRCWEGGASRASAEVEGGFGLSQRARRIHQSRTFPRQTRIFPFQPQRLHGNRTYVIH